MERFLFWEKNPKIDSGPPAYPVSAEIPHPCTKVSPLLSQARVMPLQEWEQTYRDL